MTEYLLSRKRALLIKEAGHMGEGVRGGSHSPPAGWINRNGSGHIIVVRLGLLGVDGGGNESSELVADSPVGLAPQLINALNQLGRVAHKISRAW